jgi:hypothetical protein
MSQAAKKSAGKSVKSTAATSKKSETFSAEERAAMKAYIQEKKAEARVNKSREEGERAVLAAIAKMKEPDRAMAKRLHALVSAAAPTLMPKTWYGMPAYTKDEKVVCFFKDAGKFGDRYATFGFNDKAALDDGAMWPTSYAMKELTAAGEAKLSALVKKAAG